MKRLVTASCLFLLFALSPREVEARADFDPSVEGLRIPKGALRTFDFESPESLVGAQHATWLRTGGFPRLERTPITRGAEVTPWLTSGPEDAVEGSHALRLGKDGAGLVIADAALFAQVRDGRFEVSMWTRADGAAPQLSVVYDKDPENIFGDAGHFAAVRAVRTGRETTDGWAELSTGPLDGNVWGVPARAIVIVPSYAAEAEHTFVIDALEVRAVEGKPTPPLTCTAQTVDSACGAQGDCMYGHCVSSSVTWGALPSPAHRREITERWIQFGTRLIGDRNAARNGEKILAPGARLLARSATSSRQFFGGLSRLVNLLRDNHTSFGSPSNFTSFAPQVQQSSSSVLGACFGVVEKDLLGGGMGYAVFRATEAPLSGVPLRRGDVLFAIDGREPKTWVDDVWPQVATTLPNDPAADWGPSANALSRLIATRASKVTLLRCASAASCEGASRELITVDVASPVFKALTEGTPDNISRSFSCTQRFLDSVSVAPQPDSSEDPVTTMLGSIGETRVQFDGFVGVKKWQASMTSVFAGGPERVMMDARMGHGGYYSTVEHLFHLLRGASEPMGVVSMGRGTYDLVDPPWLLERFGECAGPRGDMWSCFQGNANGFFSKSSTPAGAATRIAWLNTYDVSANDFMPKLLEGRSSFKIFAPHPTSGAFGSVVSLPGLFTAWSGGSVQVQDARFAKNLAGAATARWESGHGVPPDVVVAERLSDALDGIDTIVEAATVWLANGDK